jgi:hypothetical protein
MGISAFGSKPITGGGGGGSPLAPVISNKFRYVDMNVSSGGVARDASITTTFVNVFSYSGNGMLHGALVTLEEDKEFIIQLVVDGVDIFEGVTGAGGIDVADIKSANLYNIGTDKWGHWPIGGLDMASNTVQLVGYQYPMAFNSSVVIKIKRTTGTKKFRAGLVAISKGF